MTKIENYARIKIAIRETIEDFNYMNMEVMFNAKKHYSHSANSNVADGDTKAKRTSSKRLHVQVRRRHSLQVRRRILSGGLIAGKKRRTRKSDRSQLSRTVA